MFKLIDDKNNHTLRLKFAYVDICLILCEYKELRTVVMFFSWNPV